MGTSGAQTLDRNNHTENWRKFVCTLGDWTVTAREWKSFDRGQRQEEEKSQTQRQRQRANTGRRKSTHRSKTKTETEGKDKKVALKRKWEHKGWWQR